MVLLFATNGPQGRGYNEAAIQSSSAICTALSAAPFRS